MRVAAYQAPLLIAGDSQAIDLIREQVENCASLGVDLLCCPEAILGGLADYSDDPGSVALTREQAADLLLPLSRPEMTLIAGFTELGENGALFNAAAVVARGELLGVYRKNNPAIRRSVYTAGTALPVFTVGSCTFGIMICYDSTFPALAETLAARGASVIFVPTNTALPLDRDNAIVVEAARACDVERAVANSVTVVRADVSGRTAHLSTPGATAITNAAGALLASAEAFTPGLVVAEIEGW